MRPSEKLMLMLDLNNYNIDNYIIKMQIEYEKSGNLDLYKYNKYSDLFLSNYLYEENKNCSNRNPLPYRSGTCFNVESLDQFIVKHSQVGKKLTIKEFLAIEIFSVSEKTTILKDVVHTWIDEYHDARTKSLENLRDMSSIITSDYKNYRKPSKIAFLIALFFTLINTIIFINPQSLIPESLSFIGDPIDNWNNLLYETPIYIAYGVFATLLFVPYIYFNFSFSKQIRGVRRDKLSNVLKKVDKCDIEMNKAMTKQAKVLENYIDLVIKKPKKSRMELKRLIGPETILDKIKIYIEKVEIKHNWMSKNYSKKMKLLRIVFLSYILINLIFIGLGLAMLGGFINV